ncbi:GNAT family N-acetyltransferase [Amycolatopsis antarctica]|uniref:GNAT family N-acetyltransferase n=1 Tax=Amycolatopsis antarctica TaxID=1854586 RepID=A0A263D6C8_9PSEU|nr:GNAT family N-acetyltransferase [Amycolatopsis antarctica]OZM73749.1 GNAT family N-acetyltransferase [Amycolatopsis antarctica]
MSELVIRPGTPADQDLVLGFFDEAVAWLTERGRSGQWGTEPFSGNEKRTARVREMAESGGLSIGLLDGVPAGAITLTGTCPAHVEPAPERELYVDLLITSRACTGRGVGAALLEHGREMARERGIGLLRVDCWAGGDGALVRYYESQGFVRSGRFDVCGWIGQVFEQRVS